MEETRLEKTDNPNAVLNRKLRQFFDGKIVRKDLTKSIKEGANVPVMYWNSYWDNTVAQMILKSLKRE